MGGDGNEQQVDPAIVQVVRFKARRLAGKYGFARHDAEDIQQELILDYLQRSRHFDSRRCSPDGFGRLVINNRVAALIEAEKAACRDYRLRQSFSEPPNLEDGPGLTVRKLNWPDWRSAESDLNLRVDVERTLSRLPIALVQLCRLLMACDSALDVAALAGISRATLYRRLVQVRVAFEQAELSG